jgi:ubiquitin carboxyl-terminal hydrolase 4/11
MERSSGATKDEIWRFQEALTELSNTQSQHTERIMRLEKRLDDGARPKNAWPPASPFPSILGGSHSGKSGIVDS